MDDFFQKLADKYTVEEFSGYIGVLFDNHAEDKDIFESKKFLQDIMYIAYKCLEG